MKNLRVGQFFSVAFKDGLQAGIRVSAAPETIIGGDWIVEAVEQSASLSQVRIRSGDILVKVNNKTCIKYRYQRVQDMLSAKATCQHNVTVPDLRLVATLQQVRCLRGSHQLVYQQSMAPSMTSILKTCPSIQTPTLSPVYTQNVPFII